MPGCRPRPELRLLLKQHGAVVDASLAVGCTKAHIQAIVRGESNPGRELQARLAKYVEMPVRELFPDLRKSKAEGS